MDKFDNMLKRLKNFVDKNPTFYIWLASSMGQEATEAKPFETQLYLTNKNKFLTLLGIPSWKWKEKPAMLPRFNFMIDESLANEFEEKIRSFTINGQQIIYTRHDHGFFMIKFGHENLHQSQIDIRIGESSFTPEELGLENVEIKDKSGTTAYHIPNGILFMYNFGNQKNEQTEISTTDIAPMILANYNIKKPEYMRASGVLINTII